MSLIEKIETVGAKGHLLEDTIKNLKEWTGADFLPEWTQASIEELLEKEAWDELNDRFYKNLAFGTGGIRGRTIGQVVTAAEMGKPSKMGTPEHAAVGSNMLNDFTILRATIGLFNYVKNYLQEIGSYELPCFVVAHDVRHFSRYFCELTASTWCKLGGQALIFDGPRSTPQLSFTVRKTIANCGAVITASHNPPHDNGFKVYFSDGAQVVSPHAEGIVNLVNQVELREVSKYLSVDLAPVRTVCQDEDDAYLDVLKEIVMDNEVLSIQSPRVVFSPIHGTGAISTVPVLKDLGVEVIEVPEQMVQDPRFPTVKSPNPENSEALEMAIAKADQVKADVVIATDPDADRMGVAVRDSDGKMVLLTGNQIGALLADYRILTLREGEIIPEKGGKNIALVKTFVTSPLQEAIANSYGIKTVNTLTGFKWIGAKLAAYEAKMKERLYEEEGVKIDYDACSIWTRVDVLLDYSTFVVFGGEESYGYLVSNKVRDKDANAAAVLFCELAAYLKSQEMTFPEYLDSLYLQHGYYEEKTLNLYFEGAAGSQKISRILESYRKDPPKTLGEFSVKRFTDFGVDKLLDADDEEIPSQDFYFLELDNGYSYAVRGSGTEPKIKFYLFGRSDVPDADSLPNVKTEAAAVMQALLTVIETDARKRV
ncbi:MAG: phosphoglucomutase [Lentimonas sp.]|jgi:phosphoglucomutase